MDTKIANCENILNHSFTDKVICGRALSTYQCMKVVDGTYVVLERNSKLAVYGDLVSTSCLGRQWFERGLSSGEWSTIRSVLTNANLAAVGFNHNLQHHVHLNPGTPQVSPATMATTMEALLAAVYIDGGEAALIAVMDHLGLTHPLLA